MSKLEKRMRTYRPRCEECLRAEIARQKEVLAVQFSNHNEADNQP